MYVPVNLCLCGRSCAGRGGKGRKGKKEREEGKGGRKGSWKEEHHIFTNIRKVTWPLSVLYLSETCLFWVVNMSRGLSLEQKITFTAVWHQMLQPSWWVTYGFLIVFFHCISWYFKEKLGGVCLNLVWGAILRKTLLVHLPARTGSRQNDSPLSPLSLPQSCHCFGVSDWFNTHRVWETVQRPWVQTVETLYFFNDK